MNVIFVSISSLSHMSEHSISQDLIHEFLRNGHSIYVICALEKRDNVKTNLSEENGCKVLRVKIGNNKRANIIEKGMTTILFARKYIDAIKKYFSDVRFDLVLYPTPPVTQVATVNFIKKRDGARSFLLLKDIFPQNAVDIGMLENSGVKKSIYKYFRNIEKKLYRASDYIGCMSQANVDYLLMHNPEIDSKKVTVCPNSIEIIDKSIKLDQRKVIRDKYGIPFDKKVFVYGGNLGKPQGIPFIIECLKAVKDVSDAYFVIVGDGTEYRKLDEYARTADQNNLKLMRRLPKEDYDTLVGACDVGLIFLDHRFTIPNFPSRLLGYMQAKLPVLACTDRNTDISNVIIEGGFGWWCESNDANEYKKLVNDIIRENYQEFGINAFKFLKKNYNVENSYKIIMLCLQELSK